MEEKPGIWVHRQGKQHPTSYSFIPQLSWECNLDFPGGSPGVIFKSFEKFPATKGTVGGMQVYGAWWLLMSLFKCAWPSLSVLRKQWDQQINYTPSSHKVDRKKCLYLALISCSWLLSSCGTSWKITLRVSLCACTCGRSHLLLDCWWAWLEGGYHLWKTDLILFLQLRAHAVNSVNIICSPGNAKMLHAMPNASNTKASSST